MDTVPANPSTRMQQLGGEKLQVGFCLDFFFSFQGQGQSGCEAGTVDLLINSQRIDNQAVSNGPLAQSACPSQLHRPPPAQTLAGVDIYIAACDELCSPSSPPSRSAGRSTKLASDMKLFAIPIRMLLLLYALASLLSSHPNTDG